METIDYFKSDELLDDDKAWIDDGWQWLTNIYEKPFDLIIDNENFFPKFWKNNDPSALVDDFKNLYGFKADQLILKNATDIGDSQLPVESSGSFTDCDIEILREDPLQFGLYIPSSISSLPNYMLFKVHLAFAEIGLIQDQINYTRENPEEDDTDDFIELTSVFFGGGLLLAKYGENIGQSNYGSWSYPYRFPPQLIAYMLHKYNTELKIDDSWIDELPAIISKQYHNLI